jgi:hypothetical protein
MKGENPSSPFFFFFRNPNLTAAGFLTLANLALFWKFLSPWTHEVLSLPSGDLAGQFVWWRQFGFEELKRGHLALWNPHLYCGEPFFGGFQSALLYPPNWLFMVLPLPFALNFSIVLHVFLAGWFTYLWASNRDCRPASALLGAFLFMWGGAYFLHIVAGHLPNLCSMAWIPLVFLAVDLWRDKGDSKGILLGMFALAMQIFSGHIQYVYYTTIVIGFYALLGRPVAKTRLSSLGGLVGMYLGAFALSAAQVLAGWSASWESARAQHMSLDYVDIADITMERLWCLFMPNFFGGWQNYWGGGMYWEGDVFISVTAFALALLALRVSRHPQKIFFAGMAIFLALLAIGKRGPFFVLFYKYFPLFANFRGIGKFNILITFCLAALALLGMEELFRNPAALKTLRKGAGWGAGIFLAVAAAFRLTPPDARVFGKFGGHAGQMELSLLECGLILGLLSLLSWAAQKRPSFRYGFLALAVMELFLFARANLPSFDFKALDAKADQVRETYEKDKGDYRVLVEQGNLTLGTPGLDIWGDDPAVPARYANFASATQQFNFYSDMPRFPFFRTLPPCLGLLRLRYVFRNGEGGFIREKSGFEEAPRAFLADRFEVLEKDSILSRVLQADFEPLKEVLLESNPGIPSLSAKPQGHLSIQDISTDKADVRADLSQPALLVLTDNYSKGWKASPASIGEKQQYAVLPANGFQMAIPLSAGPHHFYLEYRPTAYVAGKWLSIFSWSAFFVFIFLSGVVPPKISKNPQ